MQQGRPTKKEEKQLLPKPAAITSCVPLPPSPRPLHESLFLTRVAGKGGEEPEKEGYSSICLKRLHNFW